MKLNTNQVLIRLLCSFMISPFARHSMIAEGFTTPAPRGAHVQKSGSLRHLQPRALQSRGARRRPEQPSEVTLAMYKGKKVELSPARSSSKHRSQPKGMVIRDIADRINGDDAAPELTDPSSPDFLPEIPRPPRDGAHPDFPFENVVFQGGGAKAQIYAGTAAALEDLGVLPHLKKFGGASAGAFAALLFALGLSAPQVREEIESANFLELVEDGHVEGFGGKYLINQFVLGRNLFLQNGMHPGERLHEYVGEIIRKYSGYADLTFRQLYESYGVELCVTISNVSRATSEFCHVKWTPDLPIRDALRISMSLPVLLSPVQMGKDLDYYIDGGVFNNYPLTAFDGWWLSMEEGNDILSKCAAEYSADSLNHEEESARIRREVLKTRFDLTDMTTIGFKMKSADDVDNVAYMAGPTMPTSDSDLLNIEIPHTNLGKPHRAKVAETQAKRQREESAKAAFVELIGWSMNALLKAKKADGDGRTQIFQTSTMLNALEKTPPGNALRPEVFDFTTWEEFVSALDHHGKGHITVKDVSTFFQDYGVQDALMQTRNAKPINSFVDYIRHTITSLQTIQEESMLALPQNLDRTCMLDCAHIKTVDFGLDLEDKTFLFESGRRQTDRWVCERANRLSAERSVSQLLASKLEEFRAIEARKWELAKEIKALKEEAEATERTST